MILKSQTVQIKYIMFGMNPMMKRFMIKRSKYQNSLHTEDDRSLNVSRRFSKNFKQKFMKHKWKHNASLKMWHEINTKKIDDVLIDNQQEPQFDSESSAYEKKSSQNLNI